jgi:hypothetical protein
MERPGLAPAGALVVLVDARNTYRPVYLANDRPGREVWVEDPAPAKRYENLEAAHRAALAVRRRPGRAQPYAVPLRAVIASE